MQLRRLDPLAKASPYQRLLKCPVKSVSISEDQYERVRERRPELIVQQGEASVVGFPYRDYLELHYGFPDIESFRGGFVDPVERCAPAPRPEVGAGVTGLPRLSEAGVGSIYENARWLRLVTDRQGAPVALLSLRQEPAGWGGIEHALIRPAVIDQLREPLLRWACAWLRNNGGRRLRKRGPFDDR